MHRDWKRLQWAPPVQSALDLATPYSERWRAHVRLRINACPVGLWLKRREFGERLGGRNVVAIRSHLTASASEQGRSELQVVRERHSRVHGLVGQEGQLQGDHNPWSFRILE